jgi:hypothetical protein
MRLRLEGLRELFGDLGALWFVIGLAALVVIILIADRLYTGWLTNVLRNHLEAKRRLRREGGPVGLRIETETLPHRT